MPRWVYRLAMLTVCATVALLTLGAVVTTFQVGMADPVWPTYPWHLLLISWSEPRPGFLIEHSHRLAGYIVGVCALIQAVAIWRLRPRSGVAWLAVACLAAVTVQGLLGGFRVRLNALVGTDLALVHGSFAMLVFALLVSLAVVTSSGWQSYTVGAWLSDDSKRLRRVCLHTAILVYLQLVLGGFVRHLSSPLGQRGHLLVAFAVVGSVVWQAHAIRGANLAVSGLRTPMLVLMILLSLQILLGVEAWMMKFGSGVLPQMQRLTMGQAVVRTAHFLVGAGVFASAVVVVLQAYRPFPPTLHLSAVPAEPLEGAA